MAQPEVVDVQATVELDPGHRRYRVHGGLRLQNRSAGEIETVWVGVRRDITRSELSLAGAGPTDWDERFKVCSFNLAGSLKPGQETDLAYDLTVERGAATAGDPDHGVVGNGSFLLSARMVRALNEIIDRDLPMVTGLIRQEVLQGSRDSEAFERLEKEMSIWDHEPEKPEDFIEAARIFAQLRWRGVTVPPSDCLEAAVARRLRVQLFSRDAHFEQIPGLSRL